MQSATHFQWAISGNFEFRFKGLVTETRTKTTFRAGVKSGPYRTATVDDVIKVRTRGDATGWEHMFP